MRDALIEKAASFLKEGLLVSFPTETVYGLGADASNETAIRRLYQAKGRPSTHPVIVHVHSLDAVRNWAVDIPPEFFKLAESFWPGPLTMVLKRANSVLNAVTGGQDTVALRIPKHPIALALLEAFGGGLVAPSANKFGRLSPTLAQHVIDEFKDEVAMVLDGGPCNVGIESTIINLSGGRPRILRPGMISVDMLSSVIGDVEAPANSVTHATNAKNALAQVVATDTASDTGSDIRVPGALASHYAPETPLHVVPSHDFYSFLEECAKNNRRVLVVSFKPQHSGFEPSSWITLAQEPEEFARQIYGALRLLDKRNGDLIVVESPPDKDTGWSGIHDRLSRAAFRE
ncbi:MAG TPA: L-threonylcarbamoyladenylate synthase [Oculatellaceae cyanobacterium]